MLGRALAALALLALLLPLLLPGSARATPPEQRTQFVLLSFDITPGPLQRRRRSPFQSLHAALQRRRAPDEPLRSYTLFISTGGLQLDPARRWPLAAHPFLGVLPRNRPTIPYARDLRHLRSKVENLRALAQLGVELATHGVRHEHGAGWDLAQWREEVRDNQRILDLFGLPRPAGFRAPFLEAGPHAYAAYAEAGARYDAGCAGNDAWPTRDRRTGVWCFGLASVRVEGVAERVLFFDDNVRTVLGRLARERGLAGAAAERFLEEAYFEAGMEAFTRRYHGNRAPFLVSGHGTMRPAMMRIMRHVCDLPDVRCATMSEALRYVEQHPELEGAPPLHGQIVRAVRRSL